MFKCKVYRMLVFNIFVFFYKNFESCEFEFDRFSCKIDYIRVCIFDWKKDLWVFCIEDFCLLGNLINLVFEIFFCFFKNIILIKVKFFEKDE